MHAASDAPIRRVAPSEAFALVRDEGYTLVDVRSEIEFRAGHPSGSLNLPYELHVEGRVEANVDLLRAAECLFAKDSRIVLICEVGQRSLRVARRLQAAAFTNLVDVRAGMEGLRDPFGRIVEKGWRALGLPIERGLDAGAWSSLAERLGIDP